MKELGYKIKNKIQMELNYIAANNDMTVSYLKDKLEKAIEDINDGNFTLYVGFDKLLATGEKNGTIYLTINIEQIEQNEPQENLTIKSEIVIPKLKKVNLMDRHTYESYYIFYCPTESSYRYLGGTHYVGLWADDLEKAIKTCTEYVGDAIYVKNPPKGEAIGYLY